MLGKFRKAPVGLLNCLDCRAAAAAPFPLGAVVFHRELRGVSLQSHGAVV